MAIWINTADIIKLIERNMKPANKTRNEQVTNKVIRDLVKQIIDLEQEHKRLGKRTL
jgi:predicted kinase